jgi:3-hydroxymyristoyl/3-hydroxydecanoyl-(acyl carrier protein) dehydratase
VPQSNALADVVVGTDRARARVRPEHAAAACEGHFPGDPIVPGSALVALMAELAAMLVGTAHLAAVESCTFRRRIHPDAAIVVAAERVDATHVEVRIEAGGALAAAARLRYRPTR